MKNTIEHICPYCYYVITVECENEEDYGRVITRSEKVLEDHMENNHNEEYTHRKRKRMYGEGE
jgi:dephospho-CoA kinase